MRNFIESVLYSVVFLFFFIYLNGCEKDETQVYRTLESHGFSAISLEGQSDICGFNGTKFVALNPRNALVRGTVCCTDEKGCSIRF